MDFSTYQIDPGIYDEMFKADASPRDAWRQLHRALLDMSDDMASATQDLVTRTFSSEGITFTVYKDDEATERIIPIDFVPRILSALEWQEIEAGLTQRLTALNHFLADIYGAGRIIADGVVPADMVYDCPQYRKQLAGVELEHGTWVSICGTDLVRTEDGFRVLEDNLRVPSGVSYMIANRKVVKAALLRLYRSHRVRGVEHYGRLLRETLRELAPGGKPDPCTVLLTPGVFNSAFYEHMFLAREIGAQLAEGRDLEVKDGCVYMRTTTGLQQVDVIYRRVDDDFMDPQVFREDSMLGVPGLVDAWKRGNVTLANALGTGVADDKSVYVHVPDMIRYYLNEEPLLANVDTRLCRYPKDLEYTLDNLDKLVVKRVGESGGYGMLMGPQSTVEERNEYAAQLRENPAEFVSQPMLALSRAPCLTDEGFQPRHVDLRPFVLRGKLTRIVPGAFSRVALRKGSLVVNSSQGGGGKDLWVLGT